MTGQDELNDKLIELKSKAAQFFNYEQSIKLMLNSIYGAFGNPHFIFYNIDIAETITLQGKDAILYTEKLINKYFREYWHKDKTAHTAMGITVNGKIEKPISVYIDTDSIIGDSIITTNEGDIKIADLYDRSIKMGFNSAGITLNGHESIDTDLQTLNWTEDKKLHFVNIKRVIRHKVSKKKWKLKLKSGKNVIVTNDHSLIVFRNGIKIEVKPSDVLITDKVLSVY